MFPPPRGILIGGKQNDIPPIGFLQCVHKRCPPSEILTGGGTQKEVPPVGFLREGTQKMSPSLVFDEGENVPLVTHWVVYHYGDTTPDRCLECNRLTILTAHFKIKFYVF